MGVHAHPAIVQWAAIPALAGPSALATVLLFSSDTFSETMVDVAALLAVGVVWLCVFLSAQRLQQKLGPQVMTAFERLMGLILTAMSVEMLLGGIREFVKTLWYERIFPPDKRSWRCARRHPRITDVPQRRRPAFRSMPSISGAA